MKKIIKKYFLTTVAILMTGSIAYASSCANFCVPQEMTQNSDMAHHSSHMSSDMNHSMADSSGEPMEHGSSDASLECDGEYVVSLKTLKVKPVLTDLELFSSSSYLVVYSHSLKSASLSLKSNILRSPISLFIQNSSFLI